MTDLKPENLTRTLICRPLIKLTTFDHFILLTWLSHSAKFAHLTVAAQNLRLDGT